MTNKNRSTLERAAGYLEGLSWGVPDNVANAIITVVEMLDAVLKEEEE